MDGYGVYKWSNGSVFMGSWKENNMHGCGRKFYPGGAIEEGEWVEDDFVGDFTACNQQESQRSMDIANQIAAEARMFMYKPDGEVAAKNGFVMDQNPMVYAYGTEFLIPGPKGARFSVPAYAKETLRQVAGIHQAIWNKWNFKIPPQAQLVADDENDEATPPTASISLATRNSHRAFEKAARKVV